MEKDRMKEAARALVEQMTVKEAAEQLLYDAPALERLGIEAYNYWNEGLHGTARSGTATVFPQAIALAAMFDEAFLQRIADVIATQTRAKYNEARKREDRDIYKGITLWSPNINLFRDQRWGRGQETYGEDPCLTSRLGVAFIKGLQGDGKYLKTAACAKHYAVHSGPEELRHSFDAVVSDKDLEESYLPAFEAAVCEAGVESVMGAYNRTNGEPCCGSPFLLQKKLREEWQFDGHVVSDFQAVNDFHEHHKVCADAKESSAKALNAGCNLNAGDTYHSLYQAYEEGLVTEEEIREAAVRVFTTRFRLGMFAEDCEYDALGLADVDTKEQRSLSYEAACRSMVLLKNDGVLPLQREKIKRIGVVGPTAASIAVLNGNYNGTASEYVCNLDGIRAAAGEDVRLFYSEGCHLFRDRVEGLAQADDRISEALSVAENVDVLILCLGLDATLEGEEGDAGNGYAAGDKTDLYLPASQRRLFEALRKTDTPIVLVLNTGSAMDISDMEDRCSAVLQAWYSGQYGGRALGDILFGDAAPGGRLPLSFSHEGDLPEFTDYSMKGRTYRYMEKEPLYPFGYGLSYTRFAYESFTLEKTQEGVNAHVILRNVGERDGEEVVQIYLADPAAENLDRPENEAYRGRIDLQNRPKHSLCAFCRLALAKGEQKEVCIPISDKVFSIVAEDGGRLRLSGTYRLYAGGQQPDARSAALNGQKCLCESIEL